MTLGSRICLALAALFLFVNLGGAGYAIVHGELLHALVHVALLVPAGYVIGRLLARQIATY